jgi:capsular polysaccharide biosynthesis protein
LYDTLPYLFTYLELKKTIPKLKILINYPNQTNTFYKFNLEFLTKIINVDDLIIHSNNVYKEMYISTSLTHGGYSNNPPRKEIFQIYEILKNNINYSNIDEKHKTLDQIYISRRSWINNDTSNIGTDYTSRRKMMNEDLLVETLKEYGFIEIFAENLNTDEKIFLFSNAKYIIGAIGGGMANLLFSKSTTKTIVIETPYFLEINHRFKYSMDHTIIKYMRDVTTYTTSPIPLYCRVKIIENKMIGEISDYNMNNDTYLINLSNSVAGFNNKSSFKNEWFLSNEFELLDNGLNSPYTININSLLEIL